MSETKTFASSVVGSLECRVIRHHGSEDYLIEWQTLDGTIMTVTSIMVSREGLLNTATVLAEAAEKIK